jgi:hypothetical protein
MKPQLAEFVSQIKHDYSEAKLSGAWRFFWEIGEKKLVLEKAGGSIEVLTVESWAQGIESGELKQPSIEALNDLRLENWLSRAMGREDLARVVQQLREEGEEDLTRIVRVIRATGTEAIFEWRDGTCAYSIGELATQCDTKLAEAETYLFNKSFETRFKQLGKAALATSTDDVRRKYKDVPRHAVEMFIRELCKAAKMNPYPMIVVQPSVEFSRVQFGNVQTKNIQIENRARGYAWGRIAIQDQMPGLNVPEAFDLAERNSIEIKLDTSGVSVGKYQTSLIIEAEGIQETQAILVSYDIVPLDLAIQPEAVQIGRLPQGAKARTPLKISNRNQGRSAGDVRVESELSGVTFTKRFKLESRSTADIDIQVDTLTVHPGRYATNLILDGKGFPHTFKIPLSFEVTPLEVKLDPPVVNLGKIMHGTKSKTTLKISCTPDGGRLSGTTKGIRPPCAGLAVQGELKGQLSEFEINVDTARLEPGKRFKIKLLFDTNVNKLEVPIEFRTSMRPNSVVAWQTIGPGVAAGLVLYISRALLQNVEGLNQWFFSYQSGTTLIIATGAFGALVATAGLLAFRHSKIVTSIFRRLRSTKTKTSKFVKELDDGDSVHGLGLDGRSPMRNPIEGDELQSRMRSLSNEELLRIVHVDARNYRQDALSLAKAEVKRRGLEKEHS